MDWLYRDDECPSLREVRGTFLLNIVLLFCVAVEPYLFYVLSEGQNSLLEFSSSVYALDVEAMLFIWLAWCAYS